MDALRKSREGTLESDYAKNQVIESGTVVSGACVVSFPPYTTAPPIALASGVPCDPNATHRPTGDTSPPIVQIACAPQSQNLEGLFSTTVMETLPGF